MTKSDRRDTTSSPKTIHRVGPVAREVEVMLDQAQASHRCAAPNTEAQRKAFRRALRTGEVVSAAQGIYARASYWNDLEIPARVRHMVAALALLHPKWVFAGPTAGLLHGLWVGYWQLDLIYVATTRASHCRPGRGIVRIMVTDDTAVKRENIRVTSFVRTVYDCVRLSGFGQALAVVDSAVRKHKIGANRLVHNLRATCGKRRGMRRVMAIAALADARAEDGGESIARAAMIHLGFEMPELQREVPDRLDAEKRGKKNRVDFAWDLGDMYVFGELDGRDKYVNPSMLGDADLTDTLLAERRREAHLTVGDKPVRVVRFSMSEVWSVKKFGRLLDSYGVRRTGEVPEVAKVWS